MPITSCGWIFPENIVTAEGDVDAGRRSATTWWSQVLEYDLDTRTGRVSRWPQAYVSTPSTTSGVTRSSKTGARTYYRITRRRASPACDPETVRSWSIALEKRGRHDRRVSHGFRNARLQVSRVGSRCFYVPYLLWPATTERSVGLVFWFPSPSSPSRRGVRTSRLAYFKTLRSQRRRDPLHRSDQRSRTYGFGAEVRYRPSESHDFGIFEGYFLSEPEDDYRHERSGESTTRYFDPTREKFGDARWRVLYHGITSAPRTSGASWRGVINLRIDYSDFDYPQDFERSVEPTRRAALHLLQRLPLG